MQIWIQLFYAQTQNLVLHFLDPLNLEILPITFLDWCTGPNFSPSRLTDSAGHIDLHLKSRLAARKESERNREKEAMCKVM